MRCQVHTVLVHINFKTILFYFIVHAVALDAYMIFCVTLIANVCLFPIHCLQSTQGNYIIWKNQEQGDSGNQCCAVLQKIWHTVKLM